MIAWNDDSNELIHFGKDITNNCNYKAKAKKCSETWLFRNVSRMLCL